MPITRKMPNSGFIPNRADPGKVPSRRRLRRVVDRWLPITHDSMLGRITVLEHGGRERPVLTRGSPHTRFFFASAKTDLVQVGEGRGEEAFAYQNEVDARVVDYQCHPLKIETIGDDGPFSYRPDTLRQLIDGTIEMIEVKRTPADIADDEYHRRLAIIAEICRRCGWRFRMLYLDEIIGPRHRRANVDALFGRRAMRLSRPERDAAKRLAPGEIVAWGDLRDRLCPADRLRGDAAIEHLLARGVLRTDLDAHLTPDTTLEALPARAPSEIRI